MTAAARPQTTIVLTAWDRYVPGMLAHALPSLVRQDSRAEIIVVDNASTVPVPPAEGVRLVRSPVRLTVGGARNLGLHQVTTPWVVFWDADDAMLPGTLAFLEERLRADSALVAFATAIVEDPSGARHRWPRPWMPRLARFPRLFASLDCAWSLYPTTGATIMRTDAVRAAGGFCDAGSGEDWCLGVSLAFRGRIGWSERPGRVYSLAADSVWARHMGPGHQRVHARNVRRRIRQDGGIPAWARAALPVIALAQQTAIAAHLLVAAARRLRGGQSPPASR